MYKISKFRNIYKLLGGFLISLVGLFVSGISTRIDKEASALNVNKKIENETTGTVEVESKGETGEAEKKEVVPELRPSYGSYVFWFIIVTVIFLLS